MAAQPLTLAEATARALTPLHNFLTLVGASSPEAAAVGQLALRDAENHLHGMAGAIEKRCSKSPSVIYNGLTWESHRCLGCTGCNNIG